VSAIKESSKRVPVTLLLCLLALFLVVPDRLQAEPDPAMVSAERDEIYALLAMAVVYKDWQRTKQRGHNIGSVLIDPAGKPVFWARNARYITRNGTQHGEVRLIRNYLSCSDDREFLGEQTDVSYPGAIPGHGYTIYSTLEPCVMCTGMMTLTRVWRAVYVQADPEYGRVPQRLGHDASDHGGPDPYPQQFPMEQVVMEEAAQLDEAYQAWLQEDSITAFLRSPQAEEIYASADKRLRTYSSSMENAGSLAAAIRFLDSVVDAKFLATPSEDCPD
jgi:tRNA(adenine34) deaminase